MKQERISTHVLDVSTGQPAAGLRVNLYRDNTLLLTRARAIVDRLNEAEQIGTLNAHPRIGEPAEHLSARSLAEQGAESLPDLQRLNDEYERKFGFRFVVFVNRRPKAELVKELRQR